MCQWFKELFNKKEIEFVPQKYGTISIQQLSNIIKKAFGQAGMIQN